MKLRNKKTGQLGNFIINKDHFECVDLDYVPEYRNLAELSAEWEDAPEEPKEYWYIESDGSIIQNHKPTYINHLLDGLKSVGNYFETKEEAEKAVEKLKAWTRLKEKGFRFKTWGWDDSSNNEYAIYFTLDSKSGDAVDLDLLFRGEE